MAIVKQNWKPISVIGLLIVGVVLFFVEYGHRSEAMAVLQQQPPEYVVPTDVERSHVEGMLASLSLDRDALVALNLTAQQAEDVLAACRQWCANNAATLQARSDVVATRRVALRDLRMAIRGGTAGENHQQQLATAISDLAGALATYDGTADTLRASVSQLLSDSQRTTWAAISSGYGERMPLRMLDLTGAQRQSISLARRQFQSRMAESENAQERAAAAGQWQTDLDAILAPDQQTIVSGYKSNYVASSGRVADAFALVMPRE